MPIRRFKDHHGVSRTLEQYPVFLLALPQSFLGFLALGDVRHGGEKTIDLSIRSNIRHECNDRIIHLARGALRQIFKSNAFPGQCPFCIGSGVFENFEGRVQPFVQAIPPLGESRSIGRIFWDLLGNAGVWVDLGPTQGPVIFTGTAGALTQEFDGYVRRLPTIQAGGVVNAGPPFSAGPLAPGVARPSGTEKIDKI